MTKRMVSVILLAVILFNLSLGFAQEQRLINYESAANIAEKIVALTLDDGPGVGTTREILDTLKRHGVRATFFVVGQMAAAQPELIQRMVDEGHEVGNHTWSHKVQSNLQAMSGAHTRTGKLSPAAEAEIERSHGLIHRLTNGKFPIYFRPPGGGMWNWQRRIAVNQWGYDIIQWDVDCGDSHLYNGVRPSAAQIKANILRQVKPGSIILAHDIHQVTVDAMDGTITELKRRGYRFVTVSELLAMEKQPAQTQPQSAPAPTVEAPPAPVTPPPATPTPAPSSEPAPSLFNYIVKNGDNLGKICKHFKCNADQVAHLNGIPDPSKIFAGQKLKIPQ
jgi:peptidoglycan/xylan/chitin deacetylase (PgdA/CDA1 family)